jgi:hypothetical protein
MVRIMFYLKGICPAKEYIMPKEETIVMEGIVEELDEAQK